MGPSTYRKAFMGNLIDLTGQRFTRLTVCGRSARTEKYGAFWDCICDCGAKVAADSSSLRRGRVKSCGCKKTEPENNGMFKHGRTQSLEHRIWRAMRARCTSPSHPRYKWYGGRGIGVCERWQVFENFLEDMGDCPAGMSIDRINNEGNYEPGNCRWATQATQVQNQSRTKLTTETAQLIRDEAARGVPFREIGRKYGIHHTTVSACVRRRTWFNC